MTTALVRGAGNGQSKTSDVVGVSWNKRDQKWHVGVYWRCPLTHKKKRLHLGYFEVQKEAEDEMQRARAEIANSSFEAYEQKVRTERLQKKSSEYKHVSWDKRSQKWTVQLHQFGL